MLALQRSRSSSTEATPLLGGSPSPRIEHNVSTEDSEAAQDGVKQAEAITMVWSKKSLVMAYVLMFLLYFVNAFQSSITSNLSAFVTSGFESHSLIPVIYIVSSVMSSATYMPLAKILNVWDRSIGFLIMVAFATLGLVLSATCTDIMTYSISQVFYTIGFAGMIFSIDVITADTSSLRDRGLAYAFTSSPYIITAFAGSAASERFYAYNWRWAYGSFAIILPIVALPMFGILQYNRYKAKLKGLLPKKEHSDRTFAQSIVFYALELDLLGVFLLATGLVLFLLPFTIAGSTVDEWKSSYIITMLITGIGCLVAFILTERFVAPVPFLPWELLASQTVLGACLLGTSYQIAYYCWNEYYTSYLQVVYGTSISTAGYISSIFNVISGIWLLAVGFLIKKTSRFRWLLFWAVPLYMLGVTLMIYFRKPGWSVGYLILCQVLIAFGGSTMISCQQVAVSAASDHNNIASALAFLGVFGSMGGAVGSSISGAIWTNTLPGALKRLLPESAKADWRVIYESLEIQLSYPVGSPVRVAIASAYAETQTKMLVAGTGIMALSLIWMFLIKDIRLSKDAQSKGVVF
ncbi:major facilitator superfamily domain-containing protein [Aspergillus nidulans var. acristatus]